MSIACDLHIYICAEFESEDKTMLTIIIFDELDIFEKPNIA